MKSKTKRILAFLCAVVLTATSFLGNWYSKTTEVKAADDIVKLDGFTNISVKDFVDASGNVMESKEYAYANGVGRDDFRLADGTSFDKKLLSLNLNFKTAEATTRLNVAGTSAWHGIWVYPSGTGEHLFITANPGVNNEVDSFQAITVEAKKAGLTAFVNQPFNLQLSFEFGEADANNKADLHIGVYIDGELYEGKTNTLTKCNLGNIGNCLGVVHENEGTSVVVNNISSPEQLFDRITFSDFALETAKYEFENGVAAAGEASEYEQLDKVVFSGDFRFSATGNYQIIYAGDGGDNGLRFAIDSNNNMNVGWYQGGSGQTLFATTAASVGLSSFAKQTFNIIVSTELIDADKDGNENDIKIGIWVNKRICASAEGAYHIVKDCGQYLLNDLVVKGDAGNVLLRNVNPFQKNPYYYEDISQYRGEEKSYPTKIGYVFSGWYADADYTEPLEPTVTSGSAYAKFVDEDVLSVKPQIKLTVDSNNDGTVDSLGSITDLRFVTTVDGLDYRRISFYIKKDGSSKVLDVATVDTEPRLVYEKLYAVGDNNRTIEYEPTAFSWQSEYFKAFSLKDIKDGSYDVYVQVTPYWITMDGTVVEGQTLRTCVNEYNKNVSQAVSVAFIGDDTMPITGTYGPYAAKDSNDAGLYPNYLTAEYFKMIADSGVNAIHLGNVDYATQPEQVKTALTLAEKYGIGIYVYDSAIITKETLNDVKARIAEYENYQSFVGMYIVDEPTTDAYKKEEGRNVSDYKTITGFLKELNILTYVNMYPIVDTTDRSFWEIISGQYGITDKDKENYSTYVNTVIDTLQPEVLMWDHYPFAINADDRGTVVTDHNLYLWNMAEIRSQAQSNNKPFWAYVQAGANWNNDKEYFNTLNYAPTEGQFHWNINTALAFGAQGIQYFPLIQPDHFAYAGANAEAKEWDFERNGLIGAFGNKTKWYAYAQEANLHIGAMDHILMNAYNERIIAIGSATNDISGVDGVVTSTAYKKLQSASGDEALIGCFDYKGKTALYVVNYDYNNAGTVRLQFTGEYNVTMIKNAEESTTKAQEITLTNMEPGEGVLLVIE